MNKNQDEYHKYNFNYNVDGKQHILGRCKSKPFGKWKRAISGLNISKLLIKV